MGEDEASVEPSKPACFMHSRGTLYTFSFMVEWHASTAAADRRGDREWEVLTLTIRVLLPPLASLQAALLHI